MTDPTRRPQRIQLRRTKGWRMPAGRRGGGRSGHERAGFTTPTEAAAFAVDLFRRELLAMAAGPDGASNLESYLGEPRGRDLACWCPLDQPCHADVLLELANGGPQ